MADDAKTTKAATKAPKDITTLVVVPPAPAPDEEEVTVWVFRTCIYGQVAHWHGACSCRDRGMPFQ